MRENISVISSMALQQGLLAGIYKTADDVPPHQAHSRHFRHERGREPQGMVVQGRGRDL